MAFTQYIILVSSLFFVMAALIEQCAAEKYLLVLKLAVINVKKGDNE